MYAIFEDGSRQYRVEVGSTVVVDHREADPSKPLEFNRVLLIQSDSDTLIGKPVVEGAKVVGQIIGFPTTKTMTQKFRRRKASKRLRGHTQPHVEVKIKHILKAGEPTPAMDPDATAVAIALGTVMKNRAERRADKQPSSE